MQSLAQSIFHFREAQIFIAVVRLGFCPFNTGFNTGSVYASRRSVRDLSFHCILFLLHPPSTRKASNQVLQCNTLTYFVCSLTLIR